MGYREAAMLNPAIGVYSNLVIVSHNEEEFFLDFYLQAPKTDAVGSDLITRIVVSPDHAKRLSDTLTTNIQKFKGQCVVTNTRRVKSGNKKGRR